MTLLVRTSRIKLSQGQISWREIGSGPTVVFLHGSWCDSSQWLQVVELMGMDYHCLAPDLLGFGSSAFPNIHYSIELEVECLAEYLESLNLKSVYLVGHSLGGWIAASYALKYLDRVQGLVLVAPEGVQADGVRKYQWWNRPWLTAMPKLAKWLRNFRPLTKFLNQYQKIREFLQKQQHIAQNPVTCQLLFQRRYAEIKAELLQDKLDLLKVPVLILQGGQDSRPGAIAQSELYAAKTPEAKLYTIRQGGNDLPQDCPDLVAEKIREFVSQ